MDLLGPAGGKSFDIKTLHHKIIEVLYKFLDVGKLKIPSTSICA